MRVAAELCVYTNTNFVADEIVYEESAAAVAVAAAAAAPLR